MKAYHLVSNYGYSAKSAPHLVDVSRVLIYESGSTRNTVHPLLHLTRLSATGLSSVLCITLKGLKREILLFSIELSMDGDLGFVISQMKVLTLIIKYLTCFLNFFKSLIK